ncbi:MAG: phytanoyl-CoA dioxygenase family protein [Pseudomonadota bacterium]
MGKVLTDTQVAQYQNEGFLHPVQIITQDEAAQMRQALEQIESDHPDVLVGAGRNNAHIVLPFLDAFVHNQRMLDVVEDLIGPDILVWASVLFIKEPNDPGYVSWHQDYTHMGLEPHAGVSAWLALTPSTVESGCMRMIPGSHRGEILDHHDTFDEDNILTRGQTIYGIDESKAVDLLLQPGEISLHHPHTVHASSPNLSAERRIGFTIQSYIPPHVRQTKIPGHVQRARGQNLYQHMIEVQRPRAPLTPGDIATRDNINQLLAELLYDGAEQRRNL